MKTRGTKVKTSIFSIFAIASLAATFLLPASSTQVSALSLIAIPRTVAAAHVCGSKADGGTYTPSFELGCEGKGNPIADVLFAIIRFLSDGVGLVVIGSIVVGGIQYSASQGDPKATGEAIKRMRSAVLALFIYIFGYALLNYIIPHGFLR